MTKRETEIVVKGISRDDLQKLIDHWERFKSAYFWSPPGSASGRRSEESRHYRFDGFTVSANGYLSGVIVEIKISCSCKNYYVSKTVQVAGQVKPVGLAYLKKLLNKGVFE